jgi:hypothetical protein
MMALSGVEVEEARPLGVDRRAPLEIGVAGIHCRAAPHGRRVAAPMSRSWGKTPVTRGQEHP